MALENFTRGQKIFMIGLVVLLASMFTITGAMISVFSETGGAPADQGKLDGQEFRLVEFQRKRRGLGIIAALDRNSSPWADDAPEYIYARVPTLSARPQDGHDWPFNAMEPTDTSLLDVWPVYQDQNVWCHLVLVKRAKDAGVQVPSNAYVGKLITDLMNQNRQEIDKFQQKDLQRNFEDSYGGKLGEIVPTVQEAVMVRDYVASLVSAERATLTEISLIAGGNQDELKAEVARLKVDHFLEQARKDVLRENFTWRAAGAAGNFGIAGRGIGYDRLEQAYDAHRASFLQSEAKFEFDVIRAFPEEMLRANLVKFDDDMLQIMYQAVRDEMFTASEEDKQKIEERLKAAENLYELRNPDAVKDWDDAKWKEWREARRADYMRHRSFDESKTALEDALKARESLKESQGAISGFLRKLEDSRLERERKLTAQVEVIRREQQVWDGMRNYVEDLRRRFDSLDTQLHARTRSLHDRLKIEVIEQSDAATAERNLANLVDAFVAELANIERDQVDTLETTAGITTQDLERTLNDKRAEMEEFEAREKKLTPDGKEMTAEEVTARVDQYRLEIKAIEERIKLRDTKKPLVSEFAESFRAQLMGYEAKVRSLKTGDVALRQFAFRELLSELPVELGRVARDARDSIVPEREVEDYTGRSELIQADYNARQNSLRKDAADTRDMNLAALARDFNLSMQTPGGEWTWEKIVGDETYRYLEQVEGAQRFLEEPGNEAGATSGIMAAPGRGYLVLRLRAKTAKYPQGRLGAAERVLDVATLRRARELAVDALRDLRRQMLKDGWDKTVEAAKAKYGASFEIVETGWFNDRIDIANIYSEGDSDVLNYSASPSSAAPDQPFIGRIKDIKPSEGITEIVPEKRNTDPLRRPDRDQWSYLLARVTDRRSTPLRLQKDAMKEKGWRTPAEIWRNRHLANSDVVRSLVEPARVLEGHEIIQYKPEEPKEEKSEESGDSEEAKS